MIDYEAFYQGAPLIEGVPNNGVSWDIQAPQPIVVRWERAGRFRGHVLDVGCGTGDNAIFLARQGYRVTAVDIAPTAIEIARSRGDHDITWQVGDSAALTGRFDTVLASALFHCVPSEARPALARSWRAVAADDALLNLTCIADAEIQPFAVAEDELRDTLTHAGWRITRCTEDRILVAGVDDLPDLLVWLVEATAASPGACAATTP